MGCGPVDVWNPQIVADRIRKGLDVIGDTVGGILYRGEEYWEILPPGIEGQVLAVVDGIPAWIDAPGAPTLWEDDFFEVSSPPTLAEVVNRYIFFGGGDLNPAIGSLGGLLLTNQLTGNDLWTIWVSSVLGSVRGVDQFSEAKIATPGGNHRAGLFVGCKSDGQLMSSVTNLGNNSGYWLLLGTAGSPAPQIQKITNGAAVTLGATFSAVAAGDVCALTLQYGSGSNTLEFWKNGVSQGTRTDSTSPFGANGLPGFGGRGQGLNQGIQWRNVRNGALIHF